MSKRQEIRQRRKKEKIRNRIIVIGLVVVGALLIAYAMILPGMQTSQTVNATLTAIGTDQPISITPRALATKVAGQHLGDPNAPVKVVVYADFRCSGCKWYAENAEPEVIQNYVETGKVYYSYAVYIVIDHLDGADASYRAANAALCASAQNKFWEYHDILYANQFTESPDLFTDPRLVEMARSVGLNMTSFDECYQTKKYAAEVDREVNEAISLNVQGTPSIFIDGVYYEDFPNLTNGIEAALEGK
jgi:protein-disulfide isomerase